MELEVGSPRDRVLEPARGVQAVPLSSSVAAEEQVPQSLASEQGEPAPAAVLLPIVNEVASLTERHEVARPVVGRVMIPVGRREHHAGGPDLRQEVIDFQRTPDSPSCPVAPHGPLGVPPAAITEVADHPPMRPPAALTLALGPIEPDNG